MSLRLPHIIVGCGIRTNTADYKGWHEAAVRWFLDHGYAAECFEYETRGLLFRWGQDERVNLLGSRILELNAEGVIPHLVGHSNFNDVAVRAIDEFRVVERDDYDTAESWARAVTRPWVGQMHMIAAACDANFAKNGLNAAMSTGRVEEVYVYASPNDGALLAAKASRYLTFGLAGYGSLGRTGPIDEQFPARVVVEKRPGYGHSSFVTPPQLQNTLAGIARAIDLANKYPE